jgi:hypothetical protein
MNSFADSWASTWTVLDPKSSEILSPTNTTRPVEPSSAKPSDDAVAGISVARIFGDLVVLGAAFFWRRGKMRDGTNMRQRRKPQLLGRNCACIQ